MKKSKTVWIAFAVCAIILAALIAVIAFFDCWVGYSKLNKVRKGIDGSSEVVISSPLYFDRYSSVAETVLAGEEAALLADMLVDATDKVSYEGTFGSGLGYWDTQLTFLNGDERYTVYLKDEKLYVTGKQAYLFEPDGASEDVYEALYERITEILDGVE